MGRVIALVVAGLLAGMAERGGAAPLLLDGVTVLSQSPAAIEAALGRPLRTMVVPPGDVHLPEGGIARVYASDGMQIAIDFERERSTTVVVAFPDAATAPRTYEAALEALNLPTDPPAQVVQRDRREWHSLEGYFVQVIAAYPTLDRIDTIVVSVHPLP